MENAPIVSIKEKVSLDFKYLPDYAGYILHKELDPFIKELLRLYEATDIPLFRFFNSMGSDQLMALITASSREMLALIASNNAQQYIDQSINNWLYNQLPMITREQVHSQDITLVNYVRRKVFRKFITTYTADPILRENLVEEIDRFTVVLDSELFSAYIELQKQTISEINQALEKREQQLLEAQVIGQIGSFEWDLLGKQSSYTPQVFKIFEMEGPGNLTDFLNDVHPDDRERVRKAIEKAFVDGDYQSEYRYFKNGKEKIILSRGKVQFRDGKPVKMIGTVSDVTERHRFVQKLQESETLHKQAQALTHIGNWSWFIHENRISWSDEMYRIYGLEPQSEEITFERFVSFIHPDDREGRVAEVRQSLETLKVEEYHFQIEAANGTTKTLRGKGEVVVDTNNKPVIMLGTCQDVTREFTLTKQLRERERYLEELNQSLQFANQELSRTNEELESFNFIASHDLQEPLRKIQIYSNRITENGFAALSPSLQDYFGKINNASKRMQMLIEDFLSFSQTFNTTQEAEVVDVNKVLAEIIAELSTRIEEQHGSVSVSPLPSVYAVPFQIKQLLTNLIANALKYTHPGVPPEITIHGASVQGSEIADQEADPNTSYIRITVADNGIGFEPKYSAKIFELFQRLHSKNVYSGTGIGLALCKKIVKNLNGFITAESEPGKGSLFTFYLPDKKDQLRR